jgi:hypothetical protein
VRAGFRRALVPMIARASVGGVEGKRIVVRLTGEATESGKQGFLNVLGSDLFAAVLTNCHGKILLG